MNQWWKCPKCGAKIDFIEQMSQVFDEEDGEAMFDAKSGLYYHTILCECDAYWVIGIGEMGDMQKELNIPLN